MLGINLLFVLAFISPLTQICPFGKPTSKSVPKLFLKKLI